MFFTSMLKLHSSWYLFAAFQSNVSCFSAGPPDLGIVCVVLALLTKLSAFLTVIIVALAASIAAFVTAYVMFCSAAILSCFSCEYLV